MRMQRGGFTKWFEHPSTVISKPQLLPWLGDVCTPDVPLLQCYKPSCNISLTDVEKLVNTTVVETQAPEMVMCRINRFRGAQHLKSS